MASMKIVHQTLAEANDTTGGVDILSNTTAMQNNMLCLHIILSSKQTLSNIINRLSYMVHQNASCAQHVMLQKQKHKLLILELTNCSQLTKQNSLLLHCNHAPNKGKQCLPLTIQQFTQNVQFQQFQCAQTCSETMKGCLRQPSTYAYTCY